MGWMVFSDLWSVAPPRLSRPSGMGCERSVSRCRDFGAHPTSPPSTEWVIRHAPFSYYQRTTRQMPAFSPAAGKGSWSLGGWTLSPHHFYDVKGRVLYEGSGKTRKADAGLYLVKRVMGSGGGTSLAADNTSATAAGTGINYLGVATTKLWVRRCSQW